MRNELKARANEATSENNGDATNGQVATPPEAPEVTADKKVHPVAADVDAGARGEPEKEVLLYIREPRTIVFEEFERRDLAAGEVRLKTLYSGISADTEMTIYRGSSPYAHKRWDAELRLFCPAKAALCIRRCWATKKSAA